MKLIQANPNWQVRSLGREDIYAPQRVADAEAQAGIAKAKFWSGAGGTVSGAIKDYQEKKENEEVGDYYAKAQKSIYDTKAFLNRPTIPINEIPKGVEYKKTTQVTNPDGTMSEETRTAVPTHEVASAIFDSRMNDVHEMGKGTLSGRGYSAFNNKFRQTQMATAGGIMVGSAKQEYDQRVEKTTSQAQAAFVAGDAETGSDLINGSELFTAQEKVTLVHELGAAAETDQAIDLMEGDDPKLMRSRATELLDPKGYEGNLELEERQTLAKQLKSRADYLQADQIAANERQKAVAKAEMDIGIDLGRGSPAEFRKAMQEGILKPSEYASFSKRWYTKNAEKQTDAELKTLAYNAMKPGAPPLLPNKKEHRKAVDLLYEDVKDNPHLVNQLIERTTVIPSAHKELLSSYAKGTPQQQSMASASFNGLRERVPNAVSQFDQYTRERLSAFHLLQKNGVTPDRIAEMMKAKEGRSPKERDIVRSIYNEENDREDYRDELEDELHGIFKSDADVDRLLPAYEQLRFDYYEYTESHALAKKLAMQDLKAVWSETEINSSARKEFGINKKEMMYNSPVETYKGNLSAPEIEESINRFATTNGLDRKKIILESDSATNSAKPDKRSWAVSVLDEYGFPAKTELRYSPDWTAINIEREEARRQEVQAEMDRRTPDHFKNIGTVTEAVMMMGPEGVAGSSVRKQKKPKKIETVEEKVAKKKTRRGMR